MSDDRGSWATPAWLWRVPLMIHQRRAFDLDPFAAEHSTVPARRKLGPAEGFDSRAWRGLVWLQPPYSTPLLRAGMAHAAACRDRGGIVWGCVPLTTETRAWVEWGPDWGVSLGRVAFDPPPGVAASVAASSPDNRELVLALWRRGTGGLEAAERAARMLALQRGRPYYVLAREGGD